MHTVSPVWQEWLTSLLLIGAPALCLRTGAWANRRSARCRNAAVVSGISIALAAAAAHYPPFRDVAGPWLSFPGGEGVLACLGASVLLGVAWSERQRDSSRLIRVSATGLIFLLLAGLSSGSLFGHYFGQKLCANYPDARGALQQTTGITCGPAAASMLLYQSGLHVSEGELAELANTTPLRGTAPYALARAVDLVARRRQMRGCIRRVDYAKAVQLGQPFVAFMNRPSVGGHALCVLKLEEARVRVIDPLSGTREMMTRREFVAEWDPVIVWVERAGR